MVARIGSLLGVLVFASFATMPLQTQDTAVRSARLTRPPV